MRQQAFDSAATVALADDNYRYYIATGSRHTIFGSNRVYADTTGGVPPLVDWMNAMRADDKANWTNVEASPFNVVQPGDPVPPTDPNGHLLPPFDNTGPETLIICP